MGSEAKAFASRLVERMLQMGLAAQRARSGVDVKPLGQAAGVSLEMARRYAEGIAMPGADKMRAIADWLGVNLTWLRDGTGLPDSSPLREQNSAGEFIMVPRYDLDRGGAFQMRSGQIVDYLAFRPEWIRQTLGIEHADIALLTVRGDAMAPTLNNNDLVLVDARANRIEDNAIYVLNLRGTPVIKRVQHKINGDFTISCDNPAYAPETVTAEEAGSLQVFGRIVWVGRQL